MNKTHIVLHHSLTNDKQTVSWSAIREYHIKTNGWRDIGYNFGVEDIGGRYEILLGRLPDEDGAHCKELSMNQKGLGVCLVGNFDAQVPTLEQWEKAKSLVRWIMLEWKIPVANIIGHREAQAMAGLFPAQRKSCPGKLFDLDKFRSELR